VQGLVVYGFLKVHFCPLISANWREFFFKFVKISGNSRMSFDFEKALTFLEKTIFGGVLQM
jgi:hypothetical protein